MLDAAFMNFMEGEPYLYMGKISQFWDALIMPKCMGGESIVFQENWVTLHYTLNFFKSNYFPMVQRKKGDKSNSNMLNSRSCYLQQGDNNSFYKCWGPVFPATEIILSFILQLVHRLPAISSSNSCVYLMFLPCLIAAPQVLRIRLLTWDSSLNELKCRVITFCLSVSTDLCNTVFFCLIFAIEILVVNKKKKRYEWCCEDLWKGEKWFKLEIFNWCSLFQKWRRNKAIDRKMEMFQFCNLFIKKG